MVLAKYDFDINGKTISNLLEQNEFVYFIPEFYKEKLPGNLNLINYWRI